MYRRRRPQHNKIAFSFDSFLDVVTNVIGIIIRLIIVTWVGARAYTSTMMQTEADADLAAETTLAPLPKPKAENDPASKELAQAQRELNLIRNRLTRELQKLDLTQAEENGTLRQLSLAGEKRKEAEAQKKQVEAWLSQSTQSVQIAALTMEQWRQKMHKLEEDIAAVKKLPTPTKQLRYYTPISRPVRQRDEYFFECRHGKVSFIDIEGFVQEVKDNLAEAVKSQQNKRKVEIVTTPIGDFRLRYFHVLNSQFDLADRLVGHSRDDGLAWVVEPITDLRGESADVALSPQGAFRQVVDRMARQQSVATLWVYPDSFALFRQLRDYLHTRDIDVAGWPLTEGESIAASRYGSASRSQ